MTTPRRRPSRPRTPHPPGRRGGPRRPPVEDPARQAALDTLRAVRERDAYANLVLPGMLRQRRIIGRDAALATELAYGTCRTMGLLDDVLGACSERPLSTVDGVALDALRLGAYQLLRTRIPAHAAVAATVDLVRGTDGSPVAGFVNAVLRKVSEHDEKTWVDRLAPDATADPIGNLAFGTAHPKWIAQAFAVALRDTGDGLAAALAADDERPVVHLLARPGEVSAEELAAMTGGEVAPYSPYGVHLDRARVTRAIWIRCANTWPTCRTRAASCVRSRCPAAPLEGTDEHWLDLCAGPGGKAALLAALVKFNGGTLDAVERAPHRAELVRSATLELPVTVHVDDGRDPDLKHGSFDRVLVDAPCTGLGALRRRPEARWRRKPSDVAELAKLQRELLLSAMRLVRPGGVVAYVVCSPHVSETSGVVTDVVRRSGAETLDTREYFPGVPDLGDGPFVQLWPHLHGTDAMFCALLRRTS